MNANQTLSCYLIGADTLLVECGEILLAKEHTILGVISSEPRVQQWAHNKSIPVIAYQKGYGEQLKDQPFDYLFSITHLALIQDDVLALPTKGTINFHDGPLPAYAGLNTPVWALINREEQYGISWHQVTAGVDEGDLLKQVSFDVAANETSLSMNTKCFAAALESFPTLVDDLVSGNTQTVPQDLSKRSYFGKFERPEANGLLQWHKPAVDLEAFIRAFDFGHYRNLLVVPKILVNGQVLCVTGAVAKNADTAAAAGQLLSLTPEHIDIATGKGVLSLTQFSDLNGKSISPGQVQDQLGLNVGDQLHRLDTKEIDQLSTACSPLAHNDAYWATRLIKLDPVELPYKQRERTTSTQVHDYQQLAVPIPAEFSGAVRQIAIKDAVIGALGILLSRLSRKHEFDLAVSSSTMVQQSKETYGLASEYSTLHMEIDLTTSCTNALQTISAQIDQITQRNTWAKDLIARTPKLNTMPEFDSDSALPVAVFVDGDRALAGTALTLCLSQDGCNVQMFFDDKQLSPKNAEKFRRQLETIISNIANDPDKNIGELELLTQQEKNQILETWNSNTVNFDNSQCIHHIFEQRVEQHPNNTALVFEDESITYAELNNAANHLAAVLIGKGLGPDNLVGINIKRSIELMIATIAVHKAGAAYVPLDPAFPIDRIAYMIKDADMPLIISQQSIANDLPECAAEVICVEQFSTAGTFSDSALENPDVTMNSTHLAYVIYTSGSTGNPKGVMVEHRNVCNFFMGMDDCIEHETPGTWLAVTSLSFDISVLELFWTLTRGFKVVIYQEDREAVQTGLSQKQRQRAMEFGLFMWGNDDAAGSAKYRLLTEGAKFFDQNGFDSVWTPERHFGAFGGPYPNPALTSAALATITKNLNIRTGSLVTPLHHPIRIAEDWAVIDNLSDGRVGLSIAAGWQPNDFVIRPENHKNNKQIMLEQIEVVKKLWRGEKVAFENSIGDMVEIATLPRPVQKELPIWFTIAGNPDSYRQAGLLGMNVLTHLLGQSLDELAEKIRIYREARKEAGFDPATGKVTLMLHTFVGDNDNDVRELVRQPMKDYLGAAVSLVIDFAWTFPAFKRPGGPDSKPEDIDIKSLSAEDVDTILNFAFDRYFETSGLFGTPETCAKMINRCKAADINEIGCLLDFGVDTDTVLDSLPLLKVVRDKANLQADAAIQGEEIQDQSLPAQMARHNVTHLQCTPSMARMLCFDADAKKQLAKLKQMMVGGEAFPATLAKELKSVLSGRLSNMYGPTETTIWSTTYEVEDAHTIPIGRPIANTQIYILDENHQPVPVGVPGDLYIAGEGVVRGYLNRPELTEERFISVTGLNDNSRLYWTGDLAQYREDGVIEFLGRVDHQVKLRGYRIELGEIETLLSQHESIRECVLLLRADDPDDQRLTAYVVLSDDAIEPPALREYLRQKLPEYMIPNDIITLEAMPLTPNGKLDRHQLPQPSDTQAQTAQYEAPEDELQQTIVDVWQETLQINQVGVNDNFFDIGGHSLLIVKVHQLLKAKLPTPISLTDLYRFPTIKSLTEYLNSDGDEESLKKSSDRASRRRARMGLRKRGVG
jgi:natural product biosynthesis luciferase-like monooxygenase protein